MVETPDLYVWKECSADQHGVIIAAEHRPITPWDYERSI